MTNTEKNGLPVFSKPLWFVGGFVAAVIIVMVGVYFAATYWQGAEKPERLLTSDPYQLLEACQVKAPAPLRNSGEGRLVSDSDVLAWAESVVPELVAFNYENAKEKLTAQKVNFTAEGWCGFVKAMDESRMFESVLARKLEISTKRLGGAQIISKGRQNGVDAWHVQVPVSLEFQSKFESSEKIPAPIAGKLVLVVEKGSVPLKEMALVISQYVLMP